MADPANVTNVTVTQSTPLAWLNQFQQREAKVRYLSRILPDVITAYFATSTGAVIQVQQNDWRDLSMSAEQLMADATAMMAKMDALNYDEIGALPEMISQPEAQPRLANVERTVPVTSVMRIASVITGMLAVLALLGFFLSGAIIIQPSVALLMVVASIGFYIMSFSKPAPRDG